MGSFGILDHQPSDRASERSSERESDPALPSCERPKENYTRVHVNMLSVGIDSQVCCYPVEICCELHVSFPVVVRCMAWHTSVTKATQWTRPVWCDYQSCPWCWAAASSIDGSCQVEGPSTAARSSAHLEGSTTVGISRAAGGVV